MSYLLHCHGRNRVFHTHSSAASGSSLHTLTLPAAWRRVSSISILLAHSRVYAARDLHVTASAQSKCLSVSSRPWLRVHSTHLSADFAHSIICLRHGGRFHLARIIRRLHGSQSKWVVSEMFVFCSGRFVLLARRECHQRARPSEIRSLNVKQPTSTRLSPARNQIDLQRVVCVLLGSICLARK